MVHRDSSVAPWEMEEEKVLCVVRWRVRADRMEVRRRMPRPPRTYVVMSRKEADRWTDAVGKAR